MLKFLVKLVIVALVANATFRLGSAYLSLYRFKDAIEQAMLYESKKSDEELRQRVVELGSQYDLPITDDSFTLRRENEHTYVEGSYTKPVEFLPSYPYPWKFTYSTDTLVLSGSLK
jgi:hypothetical protein